MNTKDFILASSSPQRIALLRQVGYEPKDIKPADICEDCLPHEDPLPFVRRMALSKAKRIAELNPNENILACDTIVVVGKKILHKSHRVISSVCLINKNGRVSQRTVTTKIFMKLLSEEEIKLYVESKEWVGVCGYKIEGMLAAYVIKMNGSYSGVVGLPLHETVNLLKGENIR